MKTIIAASLLLTSVSASALSLFCFRVDDEKCTNRVVNTLQAMGCYPKVETLECHPSTSEPNADICEIAATNCAEPSPNLVITTSCNEGKKVSIGRYDSNITLTWWMGTFGPYIRSLCVIN